MSSNSPDGLGESPTGPELGMRLASIDLAATLDEPLLEVLNAEYRQLAYQQARVWAVMAELAVRDPTPNLQPGVRWTSAEIFASAIDEVRAELLLTRRSAEREVTYADEVARLPRVAQALRDGLIDRTRAIVLAETCFDLTDQQVTVLLDEVLPKAGRRTATELAEAVKRIAIALDPAWAERRYKEAVRDRKVVGYLNCDGSATVSGQNLPAGEAAMACARVDALAGAAKRAGARAKIDHLRADVFLGLLDGSFHGMTEAAIIADLQRRYPKPSPVVDERAAPAAAERPAPAAAETAAPAAPLPRPAVSKAQRRRVRAPRRTAAQPSRRAHAVGPLRSPNPRHREAARPPPRPGVR
jgi:hypothetical protein